MERERQSNLPELIRYAISLRPNDYFPEESPKKQAEADEICRRIFLDCKQLLVQQGQKISGRTPEEIRQFYKSGIPIFTEFAIL